MNVFWNINLKILLMKIILVVICLFLVLHISAYVMPFIVSFIISVLVEPIIIFLMNRLNFSRKIAALACVVTIFSLLTFMMYFGISKIVLELSIISKKIPFYADVVGRNIENFLIPFKIKKSFIIPIFNSLVCYFDFAVKRIIGMVMYLPNILFFLLVMVISTYFFISDKDLILKSINKFISPRILKYILKVINSYIRSQLMIATITFIQMLIGFYILNIQNICTISLALFILDLLPLFGVGFALIPWGIYEIVFYSINKGVGILIIYVSILVVRNLIEPKILGENIGLHPLIVLIGTYVGFKMFDVIGLMLGPVVIILTKNIFEEILLKYNEIMQKK